MERITEKEPPDVITSDTENATRVEPRDAPPHKRERFEEFRAYNTGLWNGPRRENKELMRRQDDLHLYDALSSQAGLTDYQQRRGRKLFDSLEINEMTGPGISAEHVVFALCVLVANNTTREGVTRYYPGQVADDQLEALADNLDLDTSKQLSLIERLRPKLNL